MSDNRWVPVSPGAPNYPQGMLSSGVDLDGAEIFIGRAYHYGELFPAMVIPSKNVCFVYYNGKQIRKDKYEVLVTEGATFSWQASSDGQVPDGAQVAEFTAGGQEVYFGRVRHDGCITLGVVQPSRGVCYYCFDGEERESSEYEVLVREFTDFF